MDDESGESMEPVGEVQLVGLSNNNNLTGRLISRKCRLL